MEVGPVQPFLLHRVGMACRFHGIPAGRPTFLIFLNVTHWYQNISTIILFYKEKMHMDIQLLIVIIIGITVGTILLRGIYRFFFVKKDVSYCGGCTMCELSNLPPKMKIEAKHRHLTRVQLLPVVVNSGHGPFTLLQLRH